VSPNRAQVLSNKPGSSFKLTKLLVQTTLVWWQQQPRVLCVRTEISEKYASCMIEVGIPTLMMEAAGLFEKWLKIFQIIGYIYHETSYLRCHPRRSSDLRQTGWTPRPTCNYPDRSVPRDCLRR
jgi:hypothetical protein